MRWASVAVTKKCAANCTESKSSVADAQVMCCGVSQCNVDVLQCYSCTNATDVSKCTSVTPCGRGETFCRTLYKTTSSGVTVTKSCAANCTVGTKETERTECCSSDRCNTLQCYTCDNESPVFECPLQTCDGDASFCMSTYNHTSGVVTKACAATCTPSSTAAMEIQCCNSPECNRKRIQCFSCKEITDETKCTSIQVCSTSDNACQSYYNTTTSGTAITKQCVSSCRAQETQSRKTTCCSGIKCNVPILTCYTCTDQTNEAKCNQNTTCKAGENYCITRYDQTSGVRKVTRNCGTSCSHSTSTSTATRCCQSLLCNKATVDAGNSAPSSGPCTFLTLLQPCLLLLLLAFLSPTQ
ncbi:keratin-associated protein 10-10-like [Amia ocellicauda]|uniref:keratin-associated protein 10-10-like n=1 Tax=Amia ocellicauda TaxID=2972642 RepID=UPI00346467FD